MLEADFETNHDANFIEDQSQHVGDPLMKHYLAAYRVPDGG